MFALLDVFLVANLRNLLQDFYPIALLLGHKMLLMLTKGLKDYICALLWLHCFARKIFLVFYLLA